MIPFRYRFHGHGSLRFVYKNGQALRNRFLTMKYTRNPRRKHPRFAVVVSKKVLKSAVGRNQIRRRIYEVLRPMITPDFPSHDIVIIVSSGEIRSLPHSELVQLLRDQVTEATGYTSRP